MGDKFPGQISMGYASPNKFKYCRYCILVLAQIHNTSLAISLVMEFEYQAVMYLSYSVMLQ